MKAQEKKTFASHKNGKIVNCYVKSEEEQRFREMWREKDEEANIKHEMKKGKSNNNKNICLVFQLE